MNSMLVIAMLATAVPNVKETANKLVTEVAGVKEKDLVVVRGDVRDISLVEELALAAMKRGGQVLQVVEREQFGPRYYTEVPEQYDAQTPAFDLKLAEMATVLIAVEGTEFPAQYNQVSPARIAARGKASRPVQDTLLKRSVRQVNLGNGLFPTAATAKRYGMTKAALEKLFWAGINVDYAKLSATGEAVKAALAGKEMQVTDSNGTDLKLKIEARPVFVSDGVISADDVKKGGAAVQTWLPAGEVYLVPVAASATGKVVFDRVPFEDGEIKGLTMTFAAGKVTAVEAKPSKAWDRWKALYDAAPAGKENFAVVDLGINTAVTVPKGSKLLSYVPAGMVTVGIGDDTWAGGTNAVPFGMYGHLQAATVTVDGKTIVDKGTLKTGAQNPS
jgi:aminopeptidase